jgi:hypothetical protein
MKQIVVLLWVVLFFALQPSFSPSTTSRQQQILSTAVPLLRTSYTSAPANDPTVARPVSSAWPAHPSVKEAGANMQRLPRPPRAAGNLCD